jgi:hypothetical protein
MLGIMHASNQDTLACLTKPIDCPRPNAEVIEYVVPSAHAARHDRSGAAADAANCALFSEKSVKVDI